MNNNWVVFLIGLGLFFLSLMGWSFYLAGSGVSSVTDKEYTRHGHMYADTEKELATAGRLGWKVECERRGEQLAVQLSRDDGEPVGGAEGLIEYLTPGSGAPFLTAALREMETGLYIANLPPAEGKEMSGNLSIRKDRALLRKRVMILF